MSTDSDAAWAEVERAAISRFSGATNEGRELALLHGPHRDRLFFGRGRRWLALLFR